MYIKDRPLGVISLDGVSSGKLSLKGYFQGGIVELVVPLKSTLNNQFTFIFHRRPS